MSSDAVPHSWYVRRPPCWSMPVCLQPRAAQRCRIVLAEDKRAARRSRLGYHLRAGGNYQLEIATAGHSQAPRSVSVVAGPLRRANDQEHRLTEDDHTVTRYDLRFGRDDTISRAPCCWWSRWERLIVRLEYGDGREDCEHALWLVVTPRRIAALVALITSVVLYGVVPWLSQTILRARDLPAAWQRFLEATSRYSVWQALVLVIFGLWLVVVISDRWQLWLRWRRERTAARREAERYRQLAEPDAGGT